MSLETDVIENDDLMNYYPEKNLMDAMAKVEVNSGQGSHRERVWLVWLDLIKAIALVWIFFNHIIERLFSYPYIANPSVNWPPLGERLAQLRPLEEYGLWNIPLNLLRYVGWAGDQGVQLFLIVSGFGLTWGLLARHGNGPLPLSRFYRRRAERVYPLWWGAHLFFVASWILTGWGLSVMNRPLYLSMMGIRVSRRLFYYFAPAWWYVGLLLQLYLVYPLLWEGLRRRGPLWLLIVSCAVAFMARALGLLLFNSYVDAWQRGAIFITRLPEFVFGISLASWLQCAPDRTDSRLRSPATVLLAMACYVLGTLLSLTLLGNAVAPFLLGVGVFVLLCVALTRISRPTTRAVSLWVWVGRHSYSLYLLHHPLILLLVPAGLATSSQRMLVRIATAVAATIVVAVALEWAVGGTLALLRRWRKEAGDVRTALRVIAVGIVAGVLLIGSELVVRWAVPQETPEFGWGERPALEPHPTFGWRLKPSRETRLRWEGYDYYVTANALGFPGPEYAAQKAPQTLRILTIGDAFTSAEGGDTAQAWPRLLEADLAARLPDRSVEVLNFAMTGYGPNQYAAVVEAFAPTHDPDVIIIGFFVNEYQDVLRSDKQFRQSIGFDRPAQQGWYAIARLSHLRRLAYLRLGEPLIELCRGRPRPHGYFLGNFSALERDWPDLQAGQQLVTKRLEQIQEVADRAGAQVVVAMIPAPVQVCGPGELAYYPRHVDLSDATRFDLEQPQRLTQELAASLGFGYYDLRPALRSGAEDCPYQPWNMHWTAAGHRAAAKSLTDWLIAEEYVR